jgi:hypothetical protein
MAEQPSRTGKKTGIRRVLWLVIGVVLIVACVGVFLMMILAPSIGNEFYSISSELGQDEQEPAMAPGSGSAQSLAAQASLRVIIREGEITLVVDDTRAAKERIETVVAEMESEGAFVVSSQEAANVESQMPTVRMVIRVPAERFDEVMERLAAMAVRVEAQSETAEDVTEEYVDLQERLESMEAARDRLRQILDEAETVEELLLVEEQLAQREADIEALRGRLEYLAQSAQLSRIEITLLPSVLSEPIGGLWQPGETARRAYSGLISTAQTLVNLLIFFGIAVLPWLVVIGLVVYVVRLVVRRFRTAKKPAEPAPE